eukprot:4422283-Pyramimonas_sp.AAC.1
MRRHDINCDEVRILYLMSVYHVTSLGLSLFPLGLAFLPRSLVVLRGRLRQDKHVTVCMPRRKNVS